MQTDIGSPKTTGQTSISGSSFTITAAGSDIAGTADKFFFAYQAIDGNVEIRARLDDLSARSSSAQAGVMIRGALTRDAAHASTLYEPAGGTSFVRRPQTAATTSTTWGASAPAPVWLRVVRTGTTLTSYSSTDGAAWVQIGQVTVSLGTTAYVGLAVSSQNPKATATAAFSQVAIIRNNLPAGQQAVDIGAPAIPGSTTFSGGSYRMHAGGSDIGGVADQFQYLYQSVTGDTDVTVRVASQTNSSALAKAGVMFRASLAANAANVALLTTPTSGYLFQRRAASGDSTASSAAGTGTAPVWLRLKRTGSLFTAYRSTDGNTWTVISSDSITMADPIYVGIAATSHSATLASDVTADNFSVAAAQAADLPPSVTLTAPANGASFTAPASISITATASDPENQLSRVDFYNGSTLLGSATTAPYSYTWSNAGAGTYSLTAMAYDASGQSTQSAPASVTVSQANQPPAVSLTAPANGASYTAPASITISATASDPENQLTRVDFYNGSTLLGSDTTAPYSFTWSNVAAGTYSLSAIARDAAGLTKQSTAVSVTVSPANRPPTVSLTSPTSGASFVAPASITISANASDPENQLTRVDFYNGSTLLGSDTTAPYSFAWSNVPAGTYSLNAVARDAAGLSTQSVSVSVTVSAVTAPPTGVIFQASVDHASVTSYRVEVFAAGANPNTATPIATQDVGKPAPNASNDISVSIPSLFSALAAGNYQLTVAAVSGTQFTRSTALAFTK
jgi:regulation of enolase protein 1 (concanavalin A-like superfamily)